MNLKKLVMSLLACCAVGAVHAQNIGDAWSALSAKDYATAYGVFKPLAENGDVKAQEQIGWLYWNGQGVAKDESQAVIWFQKAADKGSAGALYGLAMAYAGGKGVARDGQQAMLLYEKAAEKGHAKAQIRLTELKSESTDNPNLTLGLRIEAPEPTVPSECAAFSGDWFGIWQENGAKFWFKVYEVDKECNAKYSYAKDSSHKKNPRSGVIKNGVLVMELSGGARDEIAVNGNELLFK